MAAICFSMLAVAALWRIGDPTRLKSVMVEPLEAGAFVVLVARTATGFDGSIGRFLTLPGLVFAGRISYGLYIYHILVAMLFQRWLPAPLQWLLTIPSVRLVVLGTATLIVAAVSWHILEQPLNRFRQKKTRATLGRVAGEAQDVDHRPAERNGDGYVYGWRKRVLSS